MIYIRGKNWRSIVNPGDLKFIKSDLSKEINYGITI